MSKKSAIAALALWALVAPAQPQDTAPSASEPKAQVEPAADATSPSLDTSAPADPPAATAAVRDRASVEPVSWWERPTWWLVLPAWLLALAAVAVAVYAARLWKAASALQENASDASRKEFRAYVALDEIFFTEAEEAAAAAHKLRIRNYGQTPAYNISIWCERASHLPQDGVKPFYESPLVDGQLLHPVQAHTVQLESAPLYRIGKPGFFTYGRIIYRDIYKQWWITKFCFRYEGDGSFVPHSDYNDEEGPFDNRPN